jgi:hypothetical protein
VHCAIFFHLHSNASQGGIFSYPKYQFGYVYFGGTLNGRMEVCFMALWNILQQLGIFSGPFEYFTAIGYIFWPFGIFYNNLLYFLALWNILQQFVVFSGPWYIIWSFGILSGHLVYYLVIWYIFWSFGIFLVIWYIFWSFGTFSGHLVHYLVIWYIIWSFGIFSGRLVYTFSRFGMFYKEESGNRAFHKHPVHFKGRARRNENISFGTAVKCYKKRLQFFKNLLSSGQERRICLLAMSKHFSPLRTSLDPSGGQCLISPLGVKVYPRSEDPLLAPLFF